MLNKQLLLILICLSSPVNVGLVKLPESQVSPKSTHQIMLLYN